MKTFLKIDKDGFWARLALVVVEKGVLAVAVIFIGHVVSDAIEARQLARQHLSQAASLSSDMREFVVKNRLLQETLFRNRGGLSPRVANVVVAQVTDAINALEMVEIDLALVVSERPNASQGLRGALENIHSTAYTVLADPDAENDPDKLLDSLRNAQHQYLTDIRSAILN
jgi:hypothetical protein